VNRTKSTTTPNAKRRRILEVLFPEKTSPHFGSTVPGKKSQAHFGSTVPGKKVKRILEVLFPEKTSALIAGERSSAGPILPFLFLFFRVQYFHFVIFP